MCLKICGLKLIKKIKKYFFFFLIKITLQLISNNFDIIQCNKLKF